MPILYLKAWSCAKSFLLGGAPAIGCVGRPPAGAGGYGEFTIQKPPVGAIGYRSGY
ncbi:MAG: hypothetical protein ACFHW5_19975 [Verrucomicrobiota bacterium]